MVLIRKRINYVNVITHLTLFCLFLCFAKLENNPAPYSVAILSVAMALGGSYFFTPLSFLFSFILLGSSGLIASMSIVAFIVTLVAFLYRNKKSRLVAIFCFTIVGMIGYLVIGNTSTLITLEKRIIVSAITLLLTFLGMIGGNALINKGIKYKFAYDEYASLIILLIALGLGVSNLISPLFWKGVCVFAILCCLYLFGNHTGTLFSGVLAISLSIYYGNIAIVSIFLIWGIISGAVMPFNRYVASICLAVCDLCIQIIFSVYGLYTTVDFLPIICGAICFCVLPTTTLKHVKNKLSDFKEKQLVRQTINRNKSMLSNRLFELSGVFTEMKVAFTAFEKNELSQDKAKEIITSQTISSACDKCDKNQLCQNKKSLRLKGLEKMTEIGFAKGKITLIDIPNSLGEICSRPSELIYSINKLLADYRSYLLDRKNASIGRELLADEAQGVAEVLRGLALESGALLSFHTDYEKRLSDALFKGGYRVSELLIYGEKERLSISLILTMKEYSLLGLTNIINKTLGIDVSLVDRAIISDEKTYLIFKKQVPFDAVFGVSKTTKDGSTISGDTHSVMKISDDKFLIALSDGMGSGEEAQKISSVALSLIENFYKAGLNGNLILNTVNKLLSINTKDSFTALDVSVIDLKNAQADFIKYGSPYGFIIGEKGIKIVEGNSLPLGILEQLKPSVCHTDLSEETMVLLVSDGISDAFGSSGDIIDFLQEQTALNPQSLTDSLLQKAIALNDGKPKDDMTALAVRIFKKNSG